MACVKNHYNHTCILLWRHNESLCMHQSVEMMNATLFSCTGYLTRKQSVTLCLLSTEAQTDTGGRLSLLRQFSADTPPLPSLRMCSFSIHMCTAAPLHRCHFIFQSKYSKGAIKCIVSENIKRFFTTPFFYLRACTQKNTHSGGS